MVLSIVILSYNTPDLIKQCVDSLMAYYLDELKKDQLEVLIVDNASEKETIESLKDYVKDKKVNLILNKQNLGFGRGCNMGVKNAKGKFVLFLNSDTLSMDKGFIKMAQFLQNNPHVGILGGRLRNPDNSLQNSVGSFYNLFNFFIMLAGGERFGLLRSSPKRITKVDWVSGAFMMVNKALFKKIGGFDKDIFMYMEDMELCYRAKMEGIDTFYFPDVRVSHVGHASSNRGFAVYNIYKGILHFYKKYKTNFEYNVVRTFLKLKSSFVYGIGKLTRNSYYTQTYGKTLELFR